MEKRVKFQCLELSQIFGMNCEVTPMIVDFESLNDFKVDSVPRGHCPLHAIGECPRPNDCYLAKGDSEKFYVFNDPHCIV